jgi:hypothetical protein
MRIAKLTKVVLLAAGLLVGATSLWLARRPSGSPGPEGRPPAETTSREQPPDQSLSHLRGQVAALGARQQRYLEDQAALSRKIEELRTAAAGEAEPSQARDPTPPSDEERAVERLADLDRAYQAEAIDSSWRQEAEAKLGALMEDEKLAGGRLLSVDCRSSMCRLHLSLPEAAGLDPLVEVFPRVLRWNTNAFFRVLGAANGQIETVAFFSRHDHALPRRPATARN